MRLPTFRKALPAALWLTLGYVIVKYMFHHIHDPDTWWHLAAGRAMVESGRLLTTDIFSHTMPGVRWINFEWLSEIVMYTLVRAFGLGGLHFAKALVGLLVMALVIFCLRRSGVRGVLLFVFAWLAYHMLKVRLCTRVELASFVMFPLFTLLMMEASQRPRRWMRWAPLGVFFLMVLWCNLHAGFLYGVGFLVCFAVGARWSRQDATFITLVDRSVVAALLAMFVTPHGTGLVEIFVHHVVDLKDASRYVLEWMAPTALDTLYYWVFFIAAAGFAVRAVLARDRVLLLWVPAVVVFAAATASYVRTTAYFAFIGVPFVAIALARSAVQKRLMPSSPSHATAIWLLAALCLFIDRDYLTKPLPPGIVDPRSVPGGACTFVRSNDVRGTMFNSFAFGGFIEWELGPERRVFMDGRYLFYPLLLESERLNDPRYGVTDEQRWQRFFDAHGVDHAISKYEPLRLLSETAKPLGHISVMRVMYPPSRWALIYWDDEALVFVRRLPKFDALIARFEYKHVTPYDIEGLMNEVGVGRLSAQQTLRELIRHRGEAPESQKERQMGRLLLR